MENKKRYVFARFIDSRAAFVSASLVLLSACAPLNSSFSNSPGKETIYALDGVKLISTSIDRGEDPASFLQRNYTIGSESRLLLRFETLSANSLTIKSDEPVRIRLFALNETEKVKAIQTLRICPIARDWMMAATWWSAHPFNGGDWPAGAAIESDECVSAETTTPLVGESCAEPNAVCFDVNAWYNAYVVQRRINYGLAVLSSDGQTVQIYGDGAGSKVPRIHWVQSSNF